MPLVEDLLGDAAPVHQPAWRLRLGDGDRAVRRPLGDREADRLGRGHVLDTGVAEIPACHLRAAFQQVPGERAGGKRVEVVLAPAEMRDQRPERQHEHEHEPDHEEDEVYTNGTSQHGYISGADMCPSCGTISLMRAEGCRKCLTCGFSEC